MHLINVPQMIDTIRDTAIAEGEPCLFWGPPGAGKSEGTLEAARQEEADLIDIRLGQYGSVDFRGIPFVERPSEEALHHALTTWAQPSTFPFIGNPKFDPDRKKLIFLDELLGAQMAVQGVAYQLVNEKRVGEHILQPNTFLIAACNREGDKGAQNKLAAPLANRFTHFEIGADADAWVMWAATQPRVPAEMLAFLQFRKPLICNFDPKSAEKAFATPRSIFKACKYFTSQGMPENIKDASIQGAVGEAFAVEFRGFCNVIKDMPTMADIERNPLGVSIFEDKPEVRWAISVGIAGELKPDNSGAYQQYLDRLPPEFGMLSWQIALKRNESLLGTQEFVKMARTHQAIFAEANRG
jgi:hypothetical protein